MIHYIYELGKRHPVAVVFEDGQCVGLDPWDVEGIKTLGILNLALPKKCNTCGQSCIYCLKKMLDPTFDHPQFHECWGEHLWCEAEGIFYNMSFDKNGRIVYKRAS